jgi:peptidoglycan/xylan/chitin deacetylase (PgdA/CDA1 family)
VSVKAVALTFDDGPSPTYTPAILDLLKEYGAKATFFVIGREIMRYPRIVRQELQAGMEVGNHGMHHVALKGLDPTAIAADVLPVERAITAISGNRPTLYRLPKGVGDARALRTLSDMGYAVVYWSVDAHDYLPRTAGAIASQVLREVRPGSIVIFHDAGGNRQPTVDALKLLLPRLRAEGYQLVTVSQLMELARNAS